MPKTKTVVITSLGADPKPNEFITPEQFTELMAAFQNYRRAELDLTSLIRRYLKRLGARQRPTRYQKSDRQVAKELALKKRKQAKVVRQIMEAEGMPVIPERPEQPGEHARQFTGKDLGQPVLRGCDL